MFKQVKLGKRLVPSELWGLPLPPVMASNNWVLSGRKTASGKPLLANDVYLEGYRLPGVWCEMGLRRHERHLLGGTLPGIPGVPAGRRNAGRASVASPRCWRCLFAPGGFVHEDPATVVAPNPQQRRVIACFLEFMALDRTRPALAQSMQAFQNFIWLGSATKR